jgi:hypothetical protein
MARTFHEIGLPESRGFRLWLADRLDETAALDPATGEPMLGNDMADTATEIAGLLRTGGHTFGTDGEGASALGEQLQRIGEMTGDGRYEGYGVAAFYMGLWLEAIASAD